MILKHLKLSLQLHVTLLHHLNVLSLISDVFYLQNAIVWMEEPALPITSLVELIVAYALKDTLGLIVN